jgi:aconitate hydratase
MRARAGDPPRSTSQKVLAGRGDEQELRATTMRVKVDQVILSADPLATLGQPALRQLKKVKVETALAYETHCLTSRDEPRAARIPRDVVRTGVLVARAGIGFPSAVHLERFAAPGRLALSDDQRMCCLGAIGMLTLLASPAQLADVLLEGSAKLRAVRSIQVLLSGRLRPFSSVKDAALELLSRGLLDAVRRVDRAAGAPVVLEFGGPSARLLSVPERAVLCALAPTVGAAGAVFVSDERTEAYLRDQRRSKAHRALVPDPGAPCDEVIALDLSTVDPLLLDSDGRVRPVRDLEGTPVRQVVLGGDCGTSLRDLMAAAMLLKSKRVTSGLDFLIAPPSRQALEVLAQSGALLDLLATGARLIEPDQRVVTEELYPPVQGELSLRTFDPLPGIHAEARAVVASAETVAYAVATGAVGDPRAFKRPARVTTPRLLPTDDVLVVRREKSKKGESKDSVTHSPPGAPFEGTLDLVVGTELELNGNGHGGVHALVLKELDQVSWAAAHVPRLTPRLRALISPEVPASLVPRLSGAGVLALSCSTDQLTQLLEAKTLRLPKLSAEHASVEVGVGKQKLTLSWLALEEERGWVINGSVTSSPSPKQKTSP